MTHVPTPQDVFGEKEPELKDQIENVIGLPKFGQTRNLPGIAEIPPMMNYFHQLAEWEHPVPLTPSNVREWTKREPGVYLLWICPPQQRANGLRVYNHSRLAYIGKGKELQVRLGGYALALNPDRPPVYQVVRDRVQGNPQLAHDYLMLAPSEMRRTRRAWMAERGLSFQVAYTENEQEARELEDTMLAYCDTHSIMLWNTMYNRNRATWPSPMAS